MDHNLTNEQFVELRDRLRRHGHVKFPLLRSEVDDLAAQALIDLWEYLRARNSEDHLDFVSVKRIAYTIFNRRVVDFYRRTSPQFIVELETELLSDQKDERVGSLVETELYRAMLHVCVKELSQISEEDQMAIAVATGLEGTSGFPMTPTERQRLHRVRGRLAAAIKRELGDEVNGLLRDD